MENSMRRLFLGMTLGGDPHTLGIYNAAKIARMMDIETIVVPPDAAIEEKLRLIAQYQPKYLGLSYRLSKNEAIQELLLFLRSMEKGGLFQEDFAKRKICFAALPETLTAVKTTGIANQYKLFLMGQSKNPLETDLETIKFFDPISDQQVSSLLAQKKREYEPEKIGILDEIARDIIKDEKYQEIEPLPIPSAQARKSLISRIEESELPIIRTHFGIPGDTIEPTVEGINKIATACVVDEISLGSSDLSQRYFGEISKFEQKKNDGGVPYKDKEDLKKLFAATRAGNYPSLKPYCHVCNMKSFADTCFETGLLEGAHQAVPLFWFSELDGRGPMTVSEAIDQHIELVKYLAQRNLPIEMNDPNQWSSRYAHDTVFVTDYALIASVMYRCGVKNMVFQLQFNKPASTGDYGDIAKMSALQQLIRHILPDKNINIITETRSGIEHFSSELNYAKYQLARSTLLQLILNPGMIHLVSYCEADHAAQPEDIIESSKIVRSAIRHYKKNAYDILKQAKHPFVQERKSHLLNEAMYLLKAIAGLSGEQSISPLYKSLSDSNVLKEAMRRRYMTAPGITNANYKNDGIITKISPYGVVDAYESWDAVAPMPERQRIERMNEEYAIPKTIGHFTFQ